MATTKVPATRGASSAASQRHSSVLSNSPAVSEKPGSKSSTSKERALTEMSKERALCKSAKKTCPICCKVIQEATKAKDGQDAIFCDGPCQKWHHRWCASVHKDDFQKLSLSNAPFMCPSCCFSEHRQLISSLVNSVEDLKAEVARLKNHVPISVSNLVPLSTPVSADSNNTACSADVQSNINLSASKDSSIRPPAQLKTTPRGISTNQFDTKFNIVVFGVDECPIGTNRLVRHNSDLNSVASITTSMVTNINANSISDCFRLGKFNPERQRPRPILVKFIRSSDVQSVLSNRGKLSKPIYIKPYMSPEDRRNDLSLLRERWCLIQSGIERQSIKIRGMRIYVKNKLVGEITQSKFQYSPSWIPETTDAPTENSLSSSTPSIASTPLTASNQQPHSQ